MTLPRPTILVYMDLPFDNQNVLILDDPVRGVIDSPTYLIAGGVAVDVTTEAFSLHTRRGRNLELDDNSAGSCTVGLRNLTRKYDSLNTSGPHFGNLSGGLRVVITIYGQQIFDGTIDEWECIYEQSGAASASFLAVDGLGYLGRQRFYTWTTTAGETAGTRIETALSRAEVNWPAGQRNLAAGVTTLQSDVVAWPANVLTYLQLVTRSEMGNLFADRYNMLTFRGRHALIDPEPDALFCVDTTGLPNPIPFHGGTILDGSRMMANWVSVDREGGTLQSIVDWDSWAQHGTYPLNVDGLLMDSDAEAMGMAEFLASAYKEPQARVSSISVNCTALTSAQQYQVAGLDIGDVVRVVWTPRQTGSQIDQTLEVLGIEDDMSQGTAHIRVLRLAPITTSNAFIIDEDLIDGGAVITY